QRAMEAPALDLFFRGARAGVLRRRELHGFPSPRPLLAQDGERAERVAAVLTSAFGAFAPAAETCVCSRNAWNMSRLQSGALWSRSPDWCSSTSRRRYFGLKNPVSATCEPSSLSRSERRSGPRNHCASGTAKPIFGR